MAVEIEAITAVGGNVPVQKTARNARMLRQIAGREDVPVFMGADRPLRREPAGAGEFHGAEGLGDMAPFEPAAPCADGHAVDAIVDLVMGRPAKSVAVAVLGPLTNLALALRKEPALRYASVEALAAGVPVVAPRHGAFPELIQVTGGGILAEPQPAALVQPLPGVSSAP